MCDIVVDGGLCDGGVASTVVQDNPWRILREGAISEQDLLHFSNGR
jgi:tRNA A37 threonylcarbamoyladenosine synthetase subunit TsaC/SUA5/YrdC